MNGKRNQNVSEINIPIVFQVNHLYIFLKEFLIISFFCLSIVICEKLDKSKMEDIDKKKYLVPSDLTCGQFLYVIRKRLKLAPEKAIFLFVDGKIPATTAMLSSIYDQYQDKDGFLYMSYSDENVFGCEV